MREDPAGSRLTASHRDPRIVAALIYPFGSIYITNRSGITNIPGNVVQGALKEISSTSQQLDPINGRATIGTMTLTAVDLGGALTDFLREQLLDFDNGVGRREVRLFEGDSDNFTDSTWQRTATQVVDSSVSYDRGLYRFSCADIKRELRERIGALATTRLMADLAENGTTLTVDSTDGFEMLEHTASFSDAQSAIVGYLLVKKTGEAIRYTGKTPTSFTGCTRGVFRTRAQAVDVDETELEVDQHPEIEEVFYLEMPGPQMIYALTTGVILDTAISLPPSWHCGAPTAFVDEEQFRSIGTDLYDPANPAAGYRLVFSSLRGFEESDGKRFIEEQCCLPLGVFMPIGNNGKLGLRRFSRTLSDASPIAVLDESNVKSHAPADFRLGEVVNRARIRWNHDGQKFTREDILLNYDSVAIHGVGKTIELELLGLTVDRHSGTNIRQIFDQIVDRNGAPPIQFTIDLLPSMNRLETGDVVRTKLAGVRDFTNTNTLDRAFEIQSKQRNPRTGALSVGVFGSTRRRRPNDPNTSIVTPPLSDDWYSSEGVALSTVLTIVGNHVTATGSLAGSADLRDGVYYHLNDLTIDEDVASNLNVQLRVRGTLTINSKIDGKGRGLDAIDDPNTVSSPLVQGFLPSVQTLGSTCGSAGVWRTGSEHLEFSSRMSLGLSALPNFAFEVQDGALVGLPSELRGTPGAWGMGVLEGSSFTVRALGGVGGNSGAGLMIVCRGLAFGVSGEIDLSGDDGTAAATPATVGGHSIYGGGGGGGAPGGLVVLIDGNTITVPEVGAALIADHGATIQTGNPISRAPPDAPSDPWTGKGRGLGSFELGESAYFVDRVPTEQGLGDSADEGTPAPSSLTASTTDEVGVKLSWVNPASDRFDFVELFESVDNNLANATLIYRGSAETYFRAYHQHVTRYYWIRARDDVKGPSPFNPASPTGGVIATFGGYNAGWTPVLVNVRRDGQQFTKTHASSAWNASVSSREAFVRCMVSCRFDQNNKHVMIMLSDAPTTSASYTDGNHAIYGTNGGRLQIYELGSQIVADAGAYLPGDEADIVDDGVLVRYYHNGTLIHTSNSSGVPMYADSSFFDLGASISSMTFMSLQSVGTFQLDIDSVQVPAYVSDNGPIDHTETAGAGSEVPILWVTHTIDEDSDAVQVTLSCRLKVTYVPSAGTPADVSLFYRESPSGTVHAFGSRFQVPYNYDGLAVCNGVISNVILHSGGSPGAAYDFGMQSAVVSGGPTITASHTNISITAIKGKR